MGIAELTALKKLAEIKMYGLPLTDPVLIRSSRSNRWNTSNCRRSTSRPGGWGHC